MPNCEHNRRKSRCKDCGGSSICEHNIIKLNCKHCGGSQICEHNIRKHQCKDCGGSQICKHNKRKYECKDCGGIYYCEHNKRRSRCKECKGQSICEHNRIKSNCKECKGTGICKHNKHKSHCKECDGSTYCQHKKLKTYCKQCGGSALCKSTWCESYKNPKYDNYCVYCFINLFPDKPITINYKTKEKHIAEKVLEYFPDFTWITDKKVIDGCSKRRPDLLLDLGSHIVIIEIDENKHSTYDCSCENKRVMEISQDLGHRPIVFIRFNPDGYTDETGIAIKSCWKINNLGIMQIIKTREPEWNERLENLKKCIHYWTENSTEKTVEVIELYY
jgi:hypothetical protein